MIVPDGLQGNFVKNGSTQIQFSVISCGKLAVLEAIITSFEPDSLKSPRICDPFPSDPGSAPCTYVTVSDHATVSPVS